MHFNAYIRWRGMSQTLATIGSAFAKADTDGPRA
jgi:hypothetical protein